MGRTVPVSIERTEGDEGVLPTTSEVNIHISLADIAMWPRGSCWTFLNAASQSNIALILESCVVLIPIRSLWIGIM